jgi:hypothetical protein
MFQHFGPGALFVAKLEKRFARVLIGAIADAKATTLGLFTISSGGALDSPAGEAQVQSRDLRRRRLKAPAGNLPMVAGLCQVSDSIR